MDYKELKSYQKLPSLKNLLDLSTPPKKLYYCGKFDPHIFENCTAVVGSRRMTSYGERTTEMIIPQLLESGKTVVSGFMYGVDQYAHRVCVEAGGKTIAVLGWGITQKLTGGDLELAEKIISKGGILFSEWEDQKAAHWTFPARNRLVAALSQEIIIVEAAQNSGSLITARMAKKLKRQLFAIPGPITSRTSAGTNNLIATGLAKMWLPQNQQALPIPTDDPLLSLLDNEALTADEMARKLNLPVAEVGSKLSMLLLKGLILEKGGKYYLSDAYVSEGKESYAY